jgi:tetratricopeptide (TPR) repeat protein
LRASLRLNAQSAPARFNLGLALAGTRQFDEALVQFDEALKIDPAHAEALYSGAAILHARNRHAEAVARYRTAIAARPDHAAAHMNLALLLAATSDAAVADAVAALKLAERGVSITGGSDPVALDVLAIACAANQDFKRARDVAGQALRVARAAGNKALAEQIAARLAMYERGVAFRLP